MTDAHTIKITLEEAKTFAMLLCGAEALSDIFVQEQRNCGPSDEGDAEKLEICVYVWDAAGGPIQIAKARRAMLARIKEAEAAATIRVPPSSARLIDLD